VRRLRAPVADAEPLGFGLGGRDCCTGPPAGGGPVSAAASTAARAGWTAACPADGRAPVAAYVAGGPICQVYRLGLVSRLGAARVNTACARALDVRSRSS
jgi:hypothetical protein